AITVALLVLLWRALVAECLDPLFLRSVSGVGSFVHFVFLGLVVLNLVAGFQALGTLLVVGLMMLPAAAARFWQSRVKPMCVLALGFGALSSVSGLLLSYHVGAPSGPASILSAGVLYLISVFVVPRGIIATHRRPTSHRIA